MMDEFLMMQLKPKGFKFQQANIVLVMQAILIRIIYLSSITLHVNHYKQSLPLSPEGLVPLRTTISQQALLII